MRRETRRPDARPSRRRPTKNRRGLLAAAALLGVALVATPDDLSAGDALDRAIGDWHGVLVTPAGELTLIVTISAGEAGGLTAELESPDQAPGRKIPVTTVTLSGERLVLVLQPLSARFEGEWVAEPQEWSGQWTQGGSLPLTLRRGLPAARPVVEGLDGTWEGAVRRNEVDLRLILRVKTTDRGTGATLDSPDLGAYDLPVTGLSREGSAVSFTVPAAAVRFEGTLSDDGERLAGPWTRPGQPEVEVVFRRSSATAERAARPRPQTPVEPFDYHVEEVVFDNPRAEGVRLAGTLTLPQGAGPFPAAVLITGSGAQDRDETIFEHKPFAVLADHLTRHGIAVLRYDDRGYGQSTGQYTGATSADFATDANAAVGYLAARPEIDRDAIGLVGHSEGGMVAPMAAAENDEIDFLVLLAAPGTGLERLLLSQRRLMGLMQGLSVDQLERSEPLVASLYAAARNAAGSDAAAERVRALLTPSALESLGVPEPQKEVLIRQLASDWLRALLRHEPSVWLSRVRVPVLALNGSLDLQVPADENLAAIADALGDHPDATLRRLEGLNHLFQTAETGALGEYADLEETFSPRALEIVSDWIDARFGGR